MTIPSFLLYPLLWGGGGNQDDPLLPVNLATAATKIKSVGCTGEVEGEVKRLLEWLDDG